MCHSQACRRRAIGAVSSCGAYPIARTALRTFIPFKRVRGAGEQRRGGEQDDQRGPRAACRSALRHARDGLDRLAKLFQCVVIACNQRYRSRTGGELKKVNRWLVGFKYT